MREADFRLFRQALRHGKVRVDRDRASRLLQEAIRLRLAQPISLTEPVRAQIHATEGAFLEEVVRRLPAPRSRERGFGPLLPDRFPPCIRKMRRMLESGENLSHSGRFALAAFLHRAGADFETIVDAYRGAPDFDEGTTRYQVEHITRRDEGRGYSVSSCDTLRSHGLCFREGDPTAPRPQDQAPDALCHEDRLRSPIQYYGIRGGRPSTPEDSTVARSESARSGGSAR